MEASSGIFETSSDYLGHRQTYPRCENDTILKYVDDRGISVSVIKLFAFFPGVRRAPRNEFLYRLEAPAKQKGPKRRERIQKEGLKTRAAFKRNCIINLLEMKRSDRL